MKPESDTHNSDESQQPKRHPHTQLRDLLLRLPIIVLLRRSTHARRPRQRTPTRALINITLAPRALLEMRVLILVRTGMTKRPISRMPLPSRLQLDTVPVGGDVLGVISARGAPVIPVSETVPPMRALERGGRVEALDAAPEVLRGIVQCFGVGGGLELSAGCFF